MHLTPLRTNKKLFGLVIALTIWSGLSSEVQAGMVGSLNVRQAANHRETEMNTVLDILHEEQVKTRLERLGLNTAEVEQRIRRMSASELQKAASELEHIKAGKDLVLLAVIGTIFFFIYVFGSLVVGRAPEQERGLIDLRSKEPMKKVLTPSSSSQGY